MRSHVKIPATTCLRSVHMHAAYTAIGQTHAREGYALPREDTSDNLFAKHAYAYTRYGDRSDTSKVAPVPMR